MVSSVFEANFDHTIEALMEHLGVTEITLEVAGALQIVRPQPRRPRYPQAALILFAATIGVVPVLAIPSLLI